MPLITNIGNTLKAIIPHPSPSAVTLKRPATQLSPPLNAIKPLVLGSQRLINNISKHSPSWLAYSFFSSRRITQHTSYLPINTLFSRSLSNTTVTPKQHTTLVIEGKIEPSMSNFGYLVRNNCLIVDKSTMIEEFWNGPACVLITRPRRFGKSLNLSMLQHFFAKHIDGLKTEGLFDQFAIAKTDNGAFLKYHQGQYPVMLISFKDIKEKTYARSIDQFRTLIKELCGQHQYLLDSKKLSGHDKSVFSAYLKGEGTDADLANSLKMLSQIFYKAHDNKKAIILIDEYDAPLASAYEHGFLGALSDFMRNMLSSALKDNPYLQKGLMTGILRISQSGMLSGLNNLSVYTVLNPNYQHYFGFEEKEVEQLLQRKKSIPTKIKTSEETTATFKGIKALYNGYKVGETILYNPWSLMQYIDRPELKPYWTLTADDDLLKKTLLDADEEIKDKLNLLMLGKTVECSIDTNLRYEELMDNRDTIWTLLLFGGYLTVESQKQVGTKVVCEVRIPNHEILINFQDIFAEGLKEQVGKDSYNILLKKLTDGDIEGFTQNLNTLMQTSVSIKDVHGESKTPERFYHGIMIGILANLSLNDQYILTSNRESGAGFYDVMLVPKAKSKSTAIILEFKRSSTMEKMEGAANEALKQIEVKQYDSELRKYPHIEKVLTAGLAFNNKFVKSVHKEIRFPPIGL